MQNLRMPFCFQDFCFFALRCQKKKKKKKKKMECSLCLELDIHCVLKSIQLYTIQNFNILKKPTSK